MYIAQIDTINQNIKTILFIFHADINAVHLMLFWIEAINHANNDTKLMIPIAL